jgi:DNA (cytosine-5)-methyltransferase 1
VNLLSLFSGIGGMDLGLERAGMTSVGQVEIDPFCRQVLARHWPEVPRHDDVRTVCSWWGSVPRPAVHVVAGGFPCQPVSQAGRKRGQQDQRWLWPEMASVVAHLRPEWVIWENVPGLLARGLGIVHADLVGLGYRHRVGWATACSVGAPHLRRRLLGVAHARREGRGPGWAEPGIEDVPATRREGTKPSGDGERPDEPRMGGDVDGVPPWMDGWDDGIAHVAYGAPRRSARCRALGNAVVPQVAEYVGRLVMSASGCSLDEDLAVG